MAEPIVPPLIPREFEQASQSTSASNVILEENDLISGVQNWCSTKSKLLKFGITWTIHNFSLHFERGLGLESSVFTSGDPTDDTRWCLKLDMSRPLINFSSASFREGGAAGDPNAASDHNYNIPNPLPPVMMQQQHHHHPYRHPQPPEAGNNAVNNNAAQQPAPAPVQEARPPPSSAPLSDESISLWLCLLSSEKPEVWAKYKFSIVNENHQECIAARPQSRRFTAGKKCGPTLRSMDPSRRGRFLSEILHDDQLTVNCQIVVMLDTQSWMGTLNKVKIPSCSIAEDLSSLLDSSRFSDVTLCVGGRQFPVHQNVLAARSRVFYAMFDHEMLESRQRRVDILDVSAEVMDDLLHFIYSGKAPNLESLALELLVAADKYELLRLKLLCEEQLSNVLNVNNVCEVLVAADTHNSPFLRKEALDFLINKANEVMATSSFRSLESSHPHLVLEAFRLLATLHATTNSEAQNEAKRIKLSS